MARIGAWLLGAASALGLAAAVSVIAPAPQGGRGSGPVAVTVAPAGGQAVAPGGGTQPVAAPKPEAPRASATGSAGQRPVAPGSLREGPGEALSAAAPPAAGTVAPSAGTTGRPPADSSPSSAPAPESAAAPETAPEAAPEAAPEPAPATPPESRPPQAPATGIAGAGPTAPTPPAPETAAPATSNPPEVSSPAPDESVAAAPAPSAPAQPASPAEPPSSTGAAAGAPPAPGIEAAAPPGTPAPQEPSAAPDGAAAVGDVVEPSEVHAVAPVEPAPAAPAEAPAFAPVAEPADLPRALRPAGAGLPAADPLPEARTGALPPVTVAAEPGPLAVSVDGGPPVAPPAAAEGPPAVQAPQDLAPPQTVEALPALAPAPERLALPAPVAVASNAPPAGGAPAAGRLPVAPAAGTEGALPSPTAAPPAGGASGPDTAPAPGTTATFEDKQPSTLPGILPLTDRLRSNNTARLPQIGRDSSTPGDGSPQVGKFLRPPSAKPAVKPSAPSAAAVAPAPATAAPATPGSAATAAGTKEEAILAYARPFTRPDPARPLFVIVLRDIGAAGVPRAQLLTLPFPVTVVLDPLAPDASAAMRAWRRAGQEVAISMTGLPLDASPTDVSQTLQALTTSLPQSVAVIDARGTFQDNPTLSKMLVPDIADSGRGVITRAVGLNAAAQIAARDKVPAARVYRVLDAAGESQSVIGRYLDRAAFKAAQDGSVVVMGDTKPATVAAILDWVKGDKAAGVTLAPVTAVMTPGGG